MDVERDIDQIFASEVAAKISPEDAGERGHVGERDLVEPIKARRAVSAG